MKDGYKNQATYIFKIVTWALSDHCPRDASRALDLWSPWVVYQGEDSTVTPQRPQCLTEALRGIIDPQRPSDDLWPTGHLHHTLYHHDITTPYLSWYVIKRGLGPDWTRTRTLYKTQTHGLHVCNDYRATKSDEILMFFLSPKIRQTILWCHKDGLHLLFWPTAVSRKKKHQNLIRLRRLVSIAYMYMQSLSPSFITSPDPRFVMSPGPGPVRVL